MCNIAGYSGNQAAAPILLEMLRRQELYDGNVSTGIATIHEGKIYSKKIVGTVDEFLQEFDLSEFPGTIGIAHTRPSGQKDAQAVQPEYNPDYTMALVTNGTKVTKYQSEWAKAAKMLADHGYDPEIYGDDPTKVANSIKLRAWLVDYFMKQGDSIPKALAKSCDCVYTDNITVMIHQDYPESIFALRCTRPMNVILENGEVYMATTRFAFPAELKSEPTMLPLAHACEIQKSGILIFCDKMKMEPVSEMTPYTYAEGYKRFEAILKSDRAPLYFDELEFAVGREMRDLWPGDHTCIQHARLVYDMLWQFEQEGRLKREMRVQERPGGILRRRWYFSLET